MVNQVIEFDVTDAVINKLKDEYLGLKVDGIDDSDGLKTVHQARMVVKNLRVKVQKREKELKAEALAWNKKVGAEAKVIYSKLEPIETHLQEQENTVKDELERIDREKKEAEEKAMKLRMDRLVAIGVSIPYTDVVTMPEDEFEAFIAKEEDNYRIAQEKAKEEARILEEKMLAIKEAEEEAVRKEQELEMRQKKIEEELAARERKLKEEEDRIQKEKDEKIAREMAQKEAEEKAAWEEKIKAEAEAEQRAKEKELKEAEIKYKKFRKTFRHDKEIIIRFLEYMKGETINRADKFMLSTEFGRDYLKVCVSDIVSKIQSIEDSLINM